MTEPATGSPERCIIDGCQAEGTRDLYITIPGTDLERYAWACPSHHEMLTRGARND